MANPFAKRRIRICTAQCNEKTVQTEDGLCPSPLSDPIVSSGEADTMKEGAEDGEIPTEEVEEVPLNTGKIMM
ncbi:hypothetical protein SK128_020421, partial [Halocaridina rubra]